MSQVNFVMIVVYEPTRRTKEAAVEKQESCFADTAEK